MHQIIYTTQRASSLFAFFNNLALLGTLLSSLKRECIWIKNNIDVIISTGTYCTQPVCPTLHMTKDQDRGKSKINRLCDKLGELGMEVIYNIPSYPSLQGGTCWNKGHLWPGAWCHICWDLHPVSSAPTLITPSLPGPCCTVAQGSDRQD